MTLSEDRVVLVYAVSGVTLSAAFEQADHVLVAEIPAPVALAKVAAERAHVADLRPADHARRGGERRELLAQLGVFGNARQLHHRADAVAFAVGVAGDIA